MRMSLRLVILLMGAIFVIFLPLTLRLIDAMDTEFAFRYHEMGFIVFREWVLPV